MQKSLFYQYNIIEKILYYKPYFIFFDRDIKVVVYSKYLFIASYFLVV